MTNEEKIMGTCETCAYFFKVDTLIFDKYGCKLYNRYVKKGDTCANYTARPSGGTGCFLTSACVDYLGKADDCEELTLLRSFRDHYMRSTENGNALVDEYYEIAPTLVDKINASTEKDKYYSYIYSVIEKCVDLIKQGKNQETLSEYKKMVLTLKEQII